MVDQRRASGYSLYELLITLSIAVVILSLGVPSFGHLLADKQLRVESTALFHAIHRARQESVVRRRVVMSPLFFLAICFACIAALLRAKAGKSKWSIQI